MTTLPLCPSSLWWCLRPSVCLGCMELTGEVFFQTVGNILNPMQISTLVFLLSVFGQKKICHFWKLTVLCFWRFLDDIEAMLGWRPSVIYKYLWKYICLLAMLGLLGATTIQMFIKYPTYMAWNHETVWRMKLKWTKYIFNVLMLKQNGYFWWLWVWTCFCLWNLFSMVESGKKTQLQEPIDFSSQKTCCILS